VRAKTPLKAGDTISRTIDMAGTRGHPLHTRVAEERVGYQGLR